MTEACSQPETRNLSIEGLWLRHWGAGCNLKNSGGWWWTIRHDQCGRGAEHSGRIIRHQDGGRLSMRGWSVICRTEAGGHIQNRKRPGGKKSAGDGQPCRDPAEAPDHHGRDITPGCPHQILSSSGYVVQGWRALQAHLGLYRVLEKLPGLA